MKNETDHAVGTRQIIEMHVMDSEWPDEKDRTYP